MTARHRSGGAGDGLGAGQVLRAEGVTHTYTTSRAAPVTALHGVDLDTAGGEMVCVAGPSGSGKSTLCHLAAGFERPSQGRVLVCGRAPYDVRDWSLVAAVPQRHGLIGELTVAENVRLPVDHAGGPADLLDEVMDLLDVRKIGGRPAMETSLGEQQRTAIARALVLRPRLVVLDEPTGHQDDEHVDDVLNALVRAREAGTSLLVASHDERVVEVADRTVHLDEGRVAGA